MKYVYLAVSADGTHKIGQSRSPVDRMQSLASEAGQPVRLLHSVQTEHASWAEHYLHRRFSSRRVRGEWFSLAENDVAWILSLNADVVATLKEKARPDKSVRIDKRLMQKIQLIVCASNGALKLQDYIESLLRPIVEERFRELVAQMVTRSDECPADAPSEDS